MYKTIVLIAACLACGTTPPTITSFTATPDGLPLGGGTVTLAWTVTNATSISIDQGVGQVTPPGDGTVTASVAATKTFTLTASNGGSNTKTVTACVATGVPSLSVSGPTSYACHDPYKETFVVTNPTCDPITVSSIQLSAVITSSDGGTCTPPGLSTYTANPSTVGANTTSVTVLDLTANPFCCFGGACPNPFSCGEQYTSAVILGADAGTLTATSNIQVNLGGCDVVCP